MGGFTLMGARLYSPLTGRFLSRDGVQGGNDNAYTYPVDPIGSVDLDGYIEHPGGRPSPGVYVHKTIRGGKSAVAAVPSKSSKHNGYPAPYKARPKKAAPKPKKRSARQQRAGMAVAGFTGGCTLGGAAGFLIAGPAGAAVGCGAGAGALNGWMEGARNSKKKTKRGKVKDASKEAAWGAEGTRRGLGRILVVGKNPQLIPIERCGDGYLGPQERLRLRRGASEAQFSAGQ
ncbi:hypothetical protein [Mumia sp. zg.B17]|uniref:hypothetical protein n=1 Tax=Mumia sp. zg.B17 TaxID=2855446 RepID=UPI0035A86413